MPRQNTFAKNQIHLPKPKGVKSARELEFESDNSFCVTCFVQNPSMFWTYVTNTCKLRHIFTNFFAEFVFFIIFFSFLFKNYTIGDEPLPNFNFDYNTINRNFNRTYYIDIYEKYFFKHETLRINLENRHITLHSKKDLNFLSMEGFYTLCTDFHWIQVAAIVLLITTEIYIFMLKKKGFFEN